MYSLFIILFIPIFFALFYAYTHFILYFYIIISFFDSLFTVLYLFFSPICSQINCVNLTHVSSFSCKFLNSNYLNFWTAKMCHVYAIQAENNDKGVVFIYICSSNPFTCNQIANIIITFL